MNLQWGNLLHCKGYYANFKQYFMTVEKVLYGEAESEDAMRWNYELKHRDVRSDQYRLIANGIGFKTADDAKKRVNSALLEFLATDPDWINQ